MRDLKSPLLLLLSGALVVTWVFHLYDKTQYSQRLVEKIPVKDSAAIAEAIRDSMLRIYRASLTELDSTRENVDALHQKLDSKVNAVQKLRKEVNIILQNRKATSSDLAIARKKIDEMKVIIASMRQQNSGLEAEKHQLHATLEQLEQDMTDLKSNIASLSAENQQLAATVNMAKTFIAGNLAFQIVNIRSKNKEQETGRASKADKIIVSLYVQNNIISYPDTDVYLIITEPGGRVIQNAAWNSGNFISKQEGTKAFTIRDRFEYSKGEKKEIIYTVSPGHFYPGLYQLQVYHNGVLIAATEKNLL